MRVMLSEARSGFKQRIAEAEQHVKTLEELRDEKRAWLSYCKEHGKGTAYDEVRNLINALDFAIGFIKWGMK